MTEREIRTERITLPIATPEELAATIDGDRALFRQLTGFNAPEPFVAPPETGDVLDFFRDAMVNDPGIRPWFFRWMVDFRLGELVGSAGFGDHPDADGIVLIGYSVYPQFEGRGYATEAATALVEWAFEDDKVSAVRATIYPDNLGSRRVAAKAGLQFLRMVETDEDGLLELWEATRPEIG